jgi:hypothetical protein
MIVLQATWAELEGGPDEHHRRAEAVNPCETG